MHARPLVAAFATALACSASATAPARAAPPTTLVAAAPPAPHAAPGPSAADLAAAKRLFETGLKLYREGSYREALDSFKRASDIAPRASLQRNIAQCHRDLKDFASAYDAYQVLLAKYGATMNAADKRAVQRAIDELAMLTGTLRVGVTEPGATVAVDAREVGTTPMAAPLRLNLGPHAVAITKEGLEPIRREIKTSGGEEVRIDGAMPPEITTGHLVVDAPGDAKVEVLVDGTDVGPAPWEGDVKPGTHVVEAKGADRAAAPKQVDVARRDRVELMLELVPLTGRVQVDTHTTDASISVDGNPVGKGVWEGTLPPGEHTVNISAAGFRPYKRVFLVHPGETFVEDARLENEGGGGAARYEGIYSGLAVFGSLYPGGATNDLALACPSAPCDASTPFGGGLLVRVGYAFGWIAVEGVVLGAYDYSNLSLAYDGTLPASNPHAGAARTEQYAFHRFGGGGTVGVRVTSKHPHVRFTGATSVGAIQRGNLYTRSTASTTSNEKDDYTSPTISYTAPLFLFELGVLAGWENGAKFHVAALGMLEVPTGSVLAPAVGGRNLDNQALGTPALGLVSGTQFFVGPVLGFDFGM
jgi:hypothetical protein